MEQIKLHKQGGAAVIIIPASMIENTGWEDGTLLEVLEINETLHIRRKTESGALATKAWEGANKQVISSQADSLIKISRIWADFFPANTSNQPI
ncbi:AbrB/MazE/SpoVT family DNA-binding domain-containing protein, partial [Klebsiella pneumoniae]